MNNLLEHLGLLALRNPEWTSVILGLGILIQGEITILLAIYLVIGKHISLLQFIIAGLTGLFVGELFIYTLGKTLRGTRFGWKFYRKMKTNRRVQVYTYYLKRNTARVLFVAKFLPGMNALTLLLLGWTKTKWGKFLKIYIPSALFWFGTTSVVAYFISSGLYYLRASRTFKDIEFIILGIIILFFIAEYIIKRLINSSAPKDIDLADEE
jgi:membrane protein DedA with SNARE-associated domain